MLLFLNITFNDEHDNKIILLQKYKIIIANIPNDYCQYLKYYLGITKYFFVFETALLHMLL